MAVAVKGAVGAACPHPPPGWTAAAVTELPADPARNKGLASGPRG